jgi:hypothetical protein
MKKELVRDYFKLGGKRACAHVNSARPEPKQKVAAPPFSVSSDEKKSA